ncbi:MAG: DegT/DnrJ/EryC1/StrS family aminotransferase [Nitrospinota bacterium]
MIPQCNPKAGFIRHRREIERAVSKVLSSGSYILGREGRVFEEEFARFIGTKHASGVGSGTDAVELALRAVGVKAGDRVAVVSHTAVATVSAISRIGGTPLFVDIDEGFTLDASQLESLLSSREAGSVKAVIVVHLYGKMAEMPKIISVSQKYQIPVIEDCAQAHGASLDGKMAGTWGALGCFSFYPTKNLGALGDGGVVVTGNEELARKIEGLRQYGWKTRYISETTGYNSRLDEIQAAILRVKLRYLKEDNDKRRMIAELYGKRLKGVPVGLPVESGDAGHVYHQFVIRSRLRTHIQETLAAGGIGTAVHYPVPVHLQEAYSDPRFSPLKMPVTERVIKEILSLPMFPELHVKDVDYVCNRLEASLKNSKALL